MKKIIFVLFAAMPFVIVFACRHDEILPEQQASFQDDVLPIILATCQDSNCHANHPDAQFPLVDYQTIMENGSIKEFEPENSELYERISLPADDDKRMPKSPRQPLSDRNIRMIYVWIKQGAKNN
jgi:hypothetical protein